MSSDTKTRCLETGAKLAAKYGLVNVTREAIAKEVKISAVMVGKHLGTTIDRNAAIKKQMRKMGLSEPDKDAITKAGIKLRARKPVAPERKKPKTAPAKKPAKVPVKKVVKPARNKAVAAPAKPRTPRKPPSLPPIESPSA